MGERGWRGYLYTDRQARRLNSQAFPRERACKVRRSCSGKYQRSLTIRQRISENRTEKEGIVGLAPTKIANENPKSYRRTMHLGDDDGVNLLTVSVRKARVTGQRRKNASRDCGFDAALMRLFMFRVEPRNLPAGLKQGNCSILYDPRWK